MQYVSGREFWPHGKGSNIKKLLLYIKGLVNSYRILKRERARFSSFLLYSTDPYYYSFYSWVSKKIGVKFIVERSELPAIEKENEEYSSTIKGRMIIRRVLRSFKKPDAWILETQNLVDYYIPRARNDCKYLIVPMTVDIDKFSAPQKTCTPYSPYIAYCGNMSEVDGISILIRAYSLVVRKHPEYRLVLAGYSEDTPTQKELVKTLELTEKVIFLGRVPSEEVPQFLKNASILALASPTSMRSIATMPCKVGEYLCTSNPVVVTKLGEIPKYLTDGVSAYLQEADSIDAFAESLERVIDSDSTVIEGIGKAGLRVATENFNSEVQVRHMLKFFNDLKNSSEKRK